MIEHLRGKLLKADKDHIVVDAGGVGYGLDLPASTVERLPALGEEVALHVSLVVREDAMDLYGFGTLEEKSVFDIFLGVPGIGPRTALDLLSTMSIAEFVSAVRMGNVGALTRVPGLGRKKAERLVVDMKDRLKRFPPPPPEERGPGEAGEPSDGGRGPAKGEARVFDDAVAALQSLGFKPAAASRCVAAALRTMGDGTATVEEVVKLALRSSP
ncbi:MAG TPA: Holliday junction branch migration protein RuvA [Sumerlaeia bacterium]|nr:Holliday junction branch migration protein RuvA [Sumerlaeia bacterium]